MVHTSTSGRSRFTTLQLELLEDRIAPSVIESYTGPYRSVYGMQLPGVKLNAMSFIAPNGRNYQTVLEPIVPVSGISSTWLANERSWFPSWTFTPDVAPPELSYAVKDYTAYGSAWVAWMGTPGGSVGAVISVPRVAALPWIPGPGEQALWIQMITTDNPGNARISPPITFPDVAVGTGLPPPNQYPNTPFYPMADYREFFDGPARPTYTTPGNWHAETYLGLWQNNTQSVRVLINTGFQWGWDVLAQNLPRAQLTLSAYANPNPVTTGQQTTLTANLYPLLSGLPAPTGSVTFLDTDASGNIAIYGIVTRIVPIASNPLYYQAFRIATPRAPGVFTVTAVYSGDGVWGGSQFSFTLTVNPANAAMPGANDDTMSHVSSAVTVSVLANDYTPPGDALTVTAVGSASFGTAVINSGTTVTYTPTGGTIATTDKFSYTISNGNGGTAIGTVYVYLADRRPVAADDFANAHAAAVTVNVLANDADPDGEALSVSAVGAAAHGTAVMNGNNTVTYTPTSGKEDWGHSDFF